MSYDWQPIETAPKDGTAILVYAPERKYSNSEAIGVVRWEKYYACWSPAGVNGPEIDCEFREPTHWMRVEGPT